jgi:hypothetical protein
MRFFTSLVAVATLCKSVDAFPSGAGGCSAGNNAVQGAHLNNPTTGSLADGGLSISLAGVTLAAGSTTTFPVSTDTVITVTSTTKSFKGFLLRLGETGGVSTDAAWSFTGTNIQKAGACFDVGGVTHTNADSKTSISATLNLPTAATSMPLDVTIVIANNNGVSEYYYSQFILTAAAAVATPSPTPLAPVALPPNPGFPACSVCGVGMVISNPSGIVAPPQRENTTCAVFQEAGQLGYIDPLFCPVVFAVASNCGCVPGTLAPISSAPVTPAPVPVTPAPVPVTTAPVLPVTPAPVTKAPTTKAPTSAAPVPATTAPVLPVTPAPETKAPVPVPTIPTAGTVAPIIFVTPAPIPAVTPPPVPAPVVAPVLPITPAPFIVAPVVAPVVAPAVAPAAAPVWKPSSSGGMGYNMGMSPARSGKNSGGSGGMGSMNKDKRVLRLRDLESRRAARGL